MCYTFSAGVLSKVAEGMKGGKEKGRENNEDVGE